MRSVLADIRHAVRRWSVRPALAVTAILTLALGIGSATAIFSIVDGVLLRPLPWTDPDRLVSVWIVRPQWRTNPVNSLMWDRGMISWPNFRDLQQHTRALTEVAVWSRTRPIMLAGESDLVQALQVSSSLLPLLGIRPLLGRSFTPVEDDRPSEAVIVTYEGWQRRFGGDTAIIGRRLVIEEIPRTIVGVLPPRFTFEGLPPEFLLPIGTISPENRAADNYSLRAIARLARGVTLEPAARDIEPALRGSDPDARRTARLEPFADTFFAGQPRDALFLLLAGAVLLLLVACANVAGLLLGDAGGRRREFALRQAIGGGRLRLARQMFAESTTLAAAGGTLGVLAAWWITPLLIAAAPPRLPRIDTVGVDGRALAFAAASSAIAVLVFGMAPAFSGSSADPAAALRTRTGDGFRAGAHRFVVAGQVALAIVLLAGAALLQETVFHLRSVPIGFEPEQLVVARLRAPLSALAGAGPRQLALLQRLRELPGVAAVGAANTVPFGGSFTTQSIESDVRPGEPLNAFRYHVTDGYFSAMRQHVFGREFQPSDADGAGVIVSDSLARAFYGGEALGRRLRVNQRWLTIIGIVPDVRHRSYSDTHAPAFYLYAAQGNAYEVVIRTERDPRALLPIVRDVVRDFDGRLAFATLETMDTLLAGSIDDERYRALLASVFGISALVLASAALYGLLSWAVAERHREIGIRLAVGALPVDIVRLIVTEGGALVCTGLLVGIPAAFAATQAIRSQLFGVEPSAPHVFIGAALVICFAALAAMLLPAVRASRVDPVVTLRAE